MRRNGESKKGLSVGLALSGGGSRAIAFHLGCLRALHHLGILTKVTVLSGVSGGSVIAALWAYHDEPFASFDARVQDLLRRGLTWGVARQTFFSPETARIALALIVAGVPAALGAVGRTAIRGLELLGLRSHNLTRIANAISAPVPRFASRTTAFERHLRLNLFGEIKVGDVARPNLAVVLNATELRTQTAFRFGSEESGCWRYGRLTEAPTVSQAVAASAAFPAFLPSFDNVLEFEHHGKRERRRVMIADGGVYDNLGITCMLPGRSAEFSTNAYPVDFIIACVAGPGLPAGTVKPYSWGSRMRATVDTMHRRTHSQHFDLLHRMAANQEISGFLLPYLGQVDERLPNKPTDLVGRADVIDYPTDFSPMSAENLRILTTRGEQLTKLMIAAYAPLEWRQK